MSLKFHALESWELMLAARKLIGITQMEKVFKVGHSAIYKWSRNPWDEDSTDRTPLERIRMLIADVSEQGPEGADLARAMVDFIAEPLGMHCTMNAAATPDKPTLEAECLDDYPALVALHRAMLDGVDPREVEALAQDAIGEVAQSVTKFREGLA